MLKPPTIDSFKNLLNLNTPLQMKKELSTVSTFNKSLPSTLFQIPNTHILELIETTDQKETSLDEDSSSQPKGTWSFDEDNQLMQIVM